MNNHKQPLPYFVYYTPIVILAILGLSDSVYLAISHYRNYTDFTYSSFCAISGAINCDTVAQSPWSLLLSIPVAIWGILAYTGYLFVLIFVRNNDSGHIPLWSFLLIYSLLLSGFSLYFAYISTVKIQSLCIMCLGSYAVNFALLLYTFIIKNRFDNENFISSLKSSFAFFGENGLFKSGAFFLLTLTVGVLLFFPHYWEFSASETVLDVPSGITEDGNPWIGAENPVITIEEFSDYQCFQCNKLHFNLRSFVEQNPDTVRLVHYHYPMDHEFNTILVKEPYHIGSGRLALFAIAAAKQNKFWQTNDAIYGLVRQKYESFNLTKLSEKLTLDTTQLQKDLNSQEILKSLERDIRKGLKHKITGTPSFIVNGKMYSGRLPPEILDKITNEQHHK